MENLTVEEVKHIAHLANLPLNDEETKIFQAQLAETIEYINHLQEISTKNITPTSQVTGKTNEFRKDEVAPSLSQEEALRNSPNTYKGFFVSKIVWQ